MANSDSFKVYSSQYPVTHPFYIQAQGTTTSSTETAFLIGPAAGSTQAMVFMPIGNEILGSFASGNANAQPAQSSPRYGSRGQWMNEIAPYFNSSSFDGRQMNFKAFGTIAGGGTTLTSIAAAIKIYVGSVATTVTSNTTVATSGNLNIGNVKSNWYVTGQFIWDSVSSTINGQYVININNSTSSGAITAVTNLTLASGIGFGLTWTFATTSTANVIRMNEQYLEVV